MKRTYALALVAAVAMLSTPAMAQDFTGPRVGVEIGVVGDDFASTAETSYGANVGYDFDLGNVVVGATGSYTGLFDDNGSDVTELSVGARAGFKAGDKTLIYGTAAYTNLDIFNVDLDGYKVGVGVERSFGNVYANVETRYADYDSGINIYQTVIGLGYRF